MAGRIAKPVSTGRDFPLCGMRCRVSQYEGTVQLVFLTDGWPDGPSKVIPHNVFASTATPGELRAIMEHLLTLPLSEPVGDLT